MILRICTAPGQVVYSTSLTRLTAVPMPMKICSRIHGMWKAVPGYEGFYEASDDGRIRSVQRTIQQANGKTRTFPSVELKQQLNEKVGYLYVGLWKLGKFRRLRVNRLVLSAFVPPPSDAALALHINDVKTDNRLSNLRWGTGSDNSADAIRNGVHPETRKSHCPYGHPYDETNTYIRPDRKGRGCLACSARRSREQNDRLARGPRVYEKKEACVRGHEFTEENTYITPKGIRQCRACNRIRQSAYYQAKRSGRVVT